MAGGLRGRVSSLAPLGRANLCWAVAKLQATEKPQSVKACCPCAAICLVGERIERCLSSDIPCRCEKSGCCASVGLGGHEPWQSGSCGCFAKAGPGVPKCHSGNERSTARHVSLGGGHS